MKKSYISWVAGIILSLTLFTAQAQDAKSFFPPDYQVDTRIDNMFYWQKCAEAGLVPVAPVAPIPPARYTGSKLLMRGVSVIDSPDVLTTTEPSNSTQSENSIVVNPNDKNMLLNSNNSTPQPSNGSVKGADALKSFDAGATWTGTVEGAGGANSGDPAAVIDLNGRWFVGYIDNASGQSVSYSDNQGATWSVAKVAAGTAFNMLDKNHLWVDISPTSAYKGYLYDGWMANNQIMVSRSVTAGTSWSTPVNISAATAAGSHNQGINFKCGPDGEVYAAWAVYDNWPGDEKAIGFNSSMDGGATWGTAIRALNNLKGIRTVGVTQNMRTNSFPSMAVDLSNSPYRGTIYVVWTNTGVPGVNVGPGSSSYLIKSTDKGVTWSAPKRINSDSTSGKHHYLPWITCDQANGYLSVVFYDNRNCGSGEAEAWMAYSTDGGNTFTDLKVSDVTFTPSPIPNMASKYMGDYLAIAAYGGKTFPCWTDTRSGHCLTYVSPIDIIIPQAAIELTDNILNDATFGNGNGVVDYGETDLIGLKMKNTGNAEADGVTVELTTDNPWVTMLDSTETYGHFNIDQEIFIPNGYKFKVSDSIPNNEPIIFTVKATDAQDSITYSTFQLNAHAPDVTLLNLEVIDPAPGGNNNGRLDPGESAILMIHLQNASIWNAENVVSSISTNNSFLTILAPTVNIGTLTGGSTYIASYPVTVSSAAPIGSAAQIHDVATSKYRVTDKYYNVKIGLIVEDWETGDFTKFAWQFTDPAKPWTIDPVIRYEKLYSAKSGVITDNESTGLFVNYNVAMDDSISFFKRVSSQPLRDALKFYIDDAMVGMWSNFTDTNFRRVAYPVTAGPHTFKWVYEKSPNTTSGLDAAWTDFIVFPPQYKTAAAAGSDADICAGDTYQLHGMADSYDSLLWTTTGTGTFSNISVLDPIYTPSAQDIADGMVRLMLTAFGQNSSTDTSSMMLMIYTAPTVNAGGNLSVCRGGVVSVSGSTATAYNTLHWGTTGDGTFDDASLLHPTYSPGAQDILHGSVKIGILATGSTACPVAADSLLLTIHELPVVNLGKDTVACATQSVTLDATTASAASYLWLPSNKTTPTITVDSAGFGLTTKKVSVLVTDNNGCVGKDSVMVGFKVCGAIGELPGVGIRVYPNPNQGQFNIGLNTTTAEQLTLTVLSATGETLWQKEVRTQAGTNTEKVALNRLAPGTYMLRVEKDGNSVLVKVIIM